MPCIIGIDPGSRCTGYGIVEGEGNRLLYVANGTVQFPGTVPFPERLGTIYRRISSIIEEWSPCALAVEEVFFAHNVKSALRLGEARGAAILAGINAGLTIYQYSALQIKQAVVGYGRASKDQVGEMVRLLLKIRGDIDPNAADALAVAVCHINSFSSRLLWSRREER